MGMTYWIHTLDGETMSEDSDDHSWMHRLSDELDEACRALGVPELSSFADYTDLEYAMSDEDEEEDEEEWDEEDFDDEVNYARLKEKMEWFDPVAGLQCMEALREHVAGGWNAELDEDERSYLIEELDDCIDILKELPPEGAKFNLSVVM